MESRTNLIKSLPALSKLISSPSASRDEVFHKAEIHNPWFTQQFIEQALDSIVNSFLDESKCSQWLEPYPMVTESKKVALIMAGNLPLVGFHDLLCVLMSGHQAVIKLSDKDAYLLPWLTEQWISVLPALSNDIRFTTRLDQFDAVIATGSNNSSRYFDFYFKKYPHILRRNRNGVAVLTGKESLEELKLLSGDIFQYFGLGCRNVSKLFVPEGYDFSPWNEVVSSWGQLEDHNKYKNNLEYNFALYIINSIPHINLGSIILKEDDAIASRIGSLHYSYYQSHDQLSEVLNERRDEIQCVVSGQPIEGWDLIYFGQSQQPALDQYADGVDTMEFLSNV